MNKRIENVMEGIDGVPDMALMSLPAVVIKEFRDRIKEQEYDKEEAETARDKYIDLYHVALQREREKDTELAALRKEKDEYREAIKKAYGLSVPEPINPHCIGCGFKDKILAAALSEEAQDER